MAVLVRSAARQVPLLRRALTAAGVPVTVAGDELPLPDEPGTRPLLMLLRCALRPSALDEPTAVELLCGPLGGTDALGLRRLRRSLQLLADAAGDRNADLIAGALRDPRDLAGVSDRVAGQARRVAGLLAVATAAIAGGGNAEDVLWAIWDASGLAEQWQRASAAGGPAGAAADRDLDAVLALFDQAAHFTDTMPPGSPGLFAESLSGQEIVGDTLAERAVRDDCVRVLHRAPVQGAGVGGRGGRGRPGGDLAGPAAARVTARRGGARRDRAGGPLRSGPARPGRRRGRRHAGRASCSPRSDGCSTSLSPGPGGCSSSPPRAAKIPDQRPSRFLTELAGDDIPIERVADAHGGHRWLSLPALVADLRRSAADTAGRRLSAGPRPPSWPGWPPPGSARRTRASGTR